MQPLVQLLESIRGTNTNLVLSIFTPNGVDCIIVKKSNSVCIFVQPVVFFLQLFCNMLEHKLTFRNLHNVKRKECLDSNVGLLKYLLLCFMKIFSMKHLWLFLDPMYLSTSQTIIRIQLLSLCRPL